MPKGRESGMPEEALWQTFFEPGRMLDQLECAGSGDVVEFGCGYGNFTVEAARRVSGNVYAIDIDPLMVTATSARARATGSNNVIVQLRDFVAEGSGRPHCSASYVMLFKILHIDDPVSVLIEAFQILRPGGKLGLMHWKHDPATPRGPSMSIRPTRDQCRAWAEAAQFQFLRDVDFDCARWHWGLVLQRP